MCHHESNWELNIFGEYSIIINLLLLGLTGSFTHCIGMCGPFAVSISQIRLMSLNSSSINQIAKINAIAATPYYLGKTLTYIILMLLSYCAASSLKDLIILKYFIFILLITAVVTFIIMGIRGSTTLPKFFSKIKIGFWPMICIKMYKKNLGQNGIRGFLSGFILGFIPCGLVIAAIIQAVSLSASPFIAIIAMFCFGIATVPGLLLISFFGTALINLRSKLIFRVLYSITMFYSAYNLSVYALKLL